MPGDIFNSKGVGGRSKQHTAYRGQRDYSILPRSPSEALEPERAPEPPRGGGQRPQHPLVVFFNRLMTFLLIVLICVAGLFYLVRRQFDQPGPLAYPTVFVVPHGQGVSAIARRLEQDGIINDRWTFFIASRYFKVHDKIKAGEYNIKVNASLRDVLDTLVEGKSIDHKISFAEGLTSQQIVERLQANPDLEGTITEVPAEGTLLPDTYRFQIGDSRQDIIERMQVGRQKFLAKMWEERDPDIAVQSPEEAVILASIVEKETSRADERLRIASVFENRLKKKMRLQSDPTIIYGLVGGKGVLDHPIQQDELDRDTPYNTYKINGLPPTPIANPGRAAIEAVLKPAKTKDLYFVADGTGGHAFAPSLDEHNKNVVKWRQVERAMREQEREEAEAAAAAGNSSPDGAAPNPSPNGTAPTAGTTSGRLVAPDALLNLRSSAGLSPTLGAASAGEADAAPATPPAVGTGADVPLPRRNPLR